MPFYREVVLPGWARRGTLVDYDTAVIGPENNFGADRWPHGLP